MDERIGTALGAPPRAAGRECRHGFALGGALAQPGG